MAGAKARPVIQEVETDSQYIELDTDRKIRHRNKLYYRFNHWPIWIFVFFIAPGPWTFDLFNTGFDARLLSWLLIVMIGTASPALRVSSTTRGSSRAARSGGMWPPERTVHSIVS